MFVLGLVSVCFSVTCCDWLLVSVQLIGWMTCIHSLTHSCTFVTVDNNVCNAAAVAAADDDDDVYDAAGVAAGDDSLSVSEWSLYSETASSSPALTQVFTLVLCISFISLPH